MNADDKQSFFHKGIIKYVASVLSIFLIIFPFAFKLVYASSGNDAASYVHTTVKNENNIVAHGQYVSISVEYTVEHGKIKEGDYIVVKIPENFKNHDIQLDPRHFKGYEKQPDGSYRLIFTDAANGVAGSFSMNFIANNETKQDKEATIDVNGKKTTVTVTGQSDSSIGNKKAIEKTAFDGSSIQFGDYDYSTGTDPDDATEIGIYTPTADRVAKFRINVNHNRQNIRNVNVVDVIPTPDGVVYNNDLKLESADDVKYTNNSEGNKINITFEELTSSQEPIITYSITIKAGTRLKLDNRAIMSFTKTNGEKDIVIDSYRLKPGNGYSAADAYKTVDKTSISSDPADQTVRYTITFDPDEVFEVGRLVIDDKLDSNVKFVYAYGDESFETKYDEASHTVQIKNVKKIDGSRKRSIVIVTDFSNVPEGTEVTNTVGNTVRTIKYKGDLSLSAKKTVNGQLPRLGEVFKFKLTDRFDNVLQEVENTADGSIQFESIRFKKEDLNKEHVYFVKESSDVEGYKKDTTVYKIKVTPTDSNNDGIMEVNPVITKSDDSPVTEMTFNNEYTPSNAKAVLEVTKQLTGRQTGAQENEFEFTLTDSHGDVKDRKKNDETGKVQFDELEFNTAGIYTYTIKEVKAGITENGITYSNKTLEVTIKVVDNGKGALEATVTYANNNRTFENTYKAENAKVVLEVDKKLTNRNLEADMFEFSLTDQVGNVEKAKNVADGKVKFSELTFDEAGTYTYTIKEVKAGTTENGITYDSKTVTAKVSVIDDGQGKLHATVEYSSDGTANSTTFTNVYTPAKTQVPVKKVWNDSDNQDGKRPESITVKLLADGVETGQTRELNAVNNWQAIFTDLDADKGGTPIVYTTEEVAVAEYKSEITGDAPTGYTITNSYTPAKTQVPVKKVWSDSDNQDGKRPESITVKLLADGQDTGKNLELNKENNWSGNFTDLDVNKVGKAIVYTVEEVAVAGYKSEITGDATTGYTITNSYTPGKTQVPVKKVWNDADNQDGKRPVSVTVKLLSDGQDTGETLELNKDNNWSGSFLDLDVNKAGKAIVYTVEEVAVAGYKSEVTGDAATGFTITNSYTPETVDIKATKNWDDANNQDGKRPTKITINLLADGVKVDSKEVQAAQDGTWSVEFTKLTKYKNVNGEVTEIKYTVTEEAVAEYESSITDFDITNKYIPKTINYKVTKVWNDANNQDGKRPNSVTIQLYKSVDGSDPIAVEGKKLTLTAKDKTDDNTWVASFTNLPKYEGGKEITYSIKEIDLSKGYKASVTGQVVTNTYLPETVVLSGRKVWKDNNNQDGKRSATVTVQILNGKKVVQELEMSEKTGWKFESKPLPKYEKGKEITYTVKEITEVTGYTTINPDKPDADGQYTITNEHTPEKIKVNGLKKWDDKDNQDGIRPNSITARLIANGKDTGKTAVASEETSWKYEFTDLDRYQNGKEITYTVEEVDVPKDYKSEVNGFNITNHYTTKKTAVSGQKTWDDNDNQDGLRPKSIKVKLLANGQDTGKEATASEETGWKYEFTDLDLKKDGKEITYTVEEVDVPSGYTPEINGMNVTNHHAPEKTAVKGRKIWKGDENQKGVRPKSIKVKLFADGKDTGKEATASEATGWKYEFTDLDLKKDGKKITYTIKEANVPKGYKSEVNDFDIVNTYTPEKPGKPNESGQKPQLPNTGEKASNAAVVAGLALMAVTGGLYLASRKD